MKSFAKTIFKYNIFLLIFLLSITDSILGQQPEQIRIMAYNILEYYNTVSMGDSAFRDPYFRTIMNTVNPDIIAAAEIRGESQSLTFLNDVLNYSGTSNYKMGTFVPNTDATDVNVVFYKPTKFTFLDSKLLISSPNPDTANHPTYKYELYNNLTGDKIIIFGVHFNSGTTGGAIRNTNAETLRISSEALPIGSYFIAAGDFNFFKGGNEPAFGTLLDNSSGQAYFIDPLNLSIGNAWTSPLYYKYYTLSTRYGSSGFGGSKEKYGLKYRSDLILNSQSVTDAGGVSYISDSYRTYGNDGLHYLTSINSPPTIPEGSTIADALYYASDHLPVFADYNFEYPTPKNPPYPGSIVFTQVGVDDGNGNNFIEFMTLYRMDLTTLKITDNPVQSDGTIGTDRTFDLSYTPWTDVPGGTFIRLGTNLTDDNDASDRILEYRGDNGYTGSLPTLDVGSNQLIAYTGTASTPTYYIAGIHWGDQTGWSTSSYAPPSTSSANIELTSSSADDWYYSASVNESLFGTRNSLTSPGNWSSTSTGYIDLSGQIGNELLPVELISFTANFIKNSVHLNWNTATEVMNYGFDIERNVNGSDWSKIGFINGYGNSNVPHYYTYKDENVDVPGNYKYRLKQIDTDGKFAYSPIAETEVFGSDNYSLYENYPNPFNPTTTIEYYVPADTKVTLKILDILGREVTTLVDEEVTAGKHKVIFDASSLSSGIYIYQLRTNDKIITRKMMLLK